jgi:hypothetical protein
MDAEDLAYQLILKIGNRVLSNGSGAAVFFGAILSDVMDRTNLTEEERSDFEVHAQLYIDNFEKIIGINDEELREAALQAIESAFCMSFYHGGNPQTRLRLRAEIEKARTKNANLGRSRPEVKEIIERRAREQWKLDPKLRDKPYKTADVICGDVIKEISKLPEVPKDWEVEDPNRPIETDIKKAVDRIRRQIGRILQPDK